jgi:hypothetical protein
VQPALRPWGVLFGRGLLALVIPSLRWGDVIRRVIGAAVLAGIAGIWLGFDTNAFVTWPSARTNSFEQYLISTPRRAPAVSISVAAHAAPTSTLSGPLVSLIPAKQWLNTEPLRPQHVQGKVVLVNFWTYSYINWLRMLPHFREWWEKYGQHGLMVMAWKRRSLPLKRILAMCGRR